MEKKTDFKALSRKAKVEYIWDYYKLHILIGGCAIAFIISLIHHYVTYKEPALEIVMLNTDYAYTGGSPGLEAFIAEQNLDTENYEIIVDNSITVSETGNIADDYYTNQSLTLRFTVGEGDILFSPENVFTSYGESGCLMNLEDVLSDSELKDLEDILYYVTDIDTGITYPCGVLLPEENWTIENGYYTTPRYLGIGVTAAHPELAAEFFRYVVNY